MKSALEIDAMEPQPRSDQGITLIEVVLAIGLIAGSAMAALSIIVGCSSTDEAVREESQALRACLTAMNEVTSYDYDGDINDFVNHWQGANATFSVPDLQTANGQDAQGTVVLDTTDMERIRVIVSVTWTGRRGTRTIQLPMVITEVEK